MSTTKQRIFFCVLWPWEYCGEWPWEYQSREAIVKELKGSTLLWMFSCPLFEVWRVMSDDEISVWNWSKDKSTGQCPRN